MSEKALLYTGTVVLILLIVMTIKYSKQFFMINGIVFLLYALPLYYSFFYKGGGGSSFLWWFYLVILISLQLLILIGYLIFKYFKK